MKKFIIESIKVLFAMTLLTGVIYPLAMTGIVQLIFPHKANGSLIKLNGKIVGSELIGQAFTDDKYFWPRPSATGYDALPSGASNYAITSDTLLKLTISRRKAFTRKNLLPSDSLVPPEMIYASGSGLDPHISPEAAFLQINRVASARHFNRAQKDELRKLVSSFIEHRQLGFLGESRVNVLLLNIALDTMTFSGK
ncbi:MAG: potassium-transporting ATPase subunit KdpC [Candidatus Kryptoniota bacterium]